MSCKDPKDRTRVARTAARARWSREDPAEQGRTMRAGLKKRFLDEVDPNRELAEDERNRRATVASRDYYATIAQASHKARRENSRRNLHEYVERLIDETLKLDSIVGPRESPTDLEDLVSDVRAALRRVEAIVRKSS